MRERIAVQYEIEGPVQMLDVYYESAMALLRLPPPEQYNVVAALCIQVGLPVPPRLSPTGSPST